MHTHGNRYDVNKDIIVKAFKLPCQKDCGKKNKKLQILHGRRKISKTDST